MNLRVFLLILLLANLLVGAANLGWIARAPGGEPERLGAQLHPESLRLVAAAEADAVPAQAAPGGASAETPPVGGDAGAAAQAAQAAAPAVPASSTPAETAARPAPPAESPRSALAACLLVDGLSTAQAGVLQDEVAAWGKAWRVKDISREPSWWVHLPPSGGRDGADKRVAELHLQGVNDLFIVQDAGANQFAISLGVFKTEIAARQQAGMLRDKGVKGVLVVPRGNLTHALEIHGPDDRLPDAVARLMNKYKGSARHACSGVGSGRR